MLGLLPTFLVIFLGFAVFLWAGTLFFQGYIYSEPASALYWRAPAAGAALALFLCLWCFLDYRNPGRYNATWFEPTASDDEVFDKFWSVKGNREILYQAHKTARGLIEYSGANGRPWSRSDADGVVEAILVEDKDGQRIRFNAELTDDKKFKTAAGEPLRYVEAGGRGRVMTETYIGKLPVSHRGATLAKIVLSLFHLGLWFACLWFLLHFQWGHALGLAVVLWLVLTLTLLPIIFTKTEETAKQRVLPASSATTAHTRSPGLIVHRRPSAVSDRRQDMHDVAVLHHVTLSLQTVDAVGLGLFHGADTLEVVEADDLGTHKASGQIGVNLGRPFDRILALGEAPCPALVFSHREEYHQPHRVINRPKHLVP